MSDEYSCIPDTLKHISNVKNAIAKVTDELTHRAYIHDASKKIGRAHV